MALALKYTFSCISNYNEEAVNVEIYEEGFAGTARTFSSGWGPRNCVSVKTDNAELDPLYPIRPKVLTLNLFLNVPDDAGVDFTETNYTDIAFSDDRQYQCKLNVGVNYKFVGWFTPQETVSINAYKYGQASLVFTDGLASLKGINYQLPDEYNYQIGIFRSIIINCLNETGLELDTYYSNGLYYGADTDLIIDRIAIETVALREREGTQALSCYKVLEMLMRSIGCCLFQKDAKWQIQSFADKSQTVENYATILYSAPNATLTLTSGTFATQALVTADRVATDKSMMVNLYRPKSKVNATADFTSHVHAALNYLFRDFTGNNPNRWTFSSGSIVTRQAGLGATYGVDIQGYANSTVGFVDENIRSIGYPVKKGARILIDWRFNTLATDGIEQPNPRVQIRINDQPNMTGTAVNVSLKEDETWQSGIYWLQQGNNGVFGSVVDVEHDGYIFLLIGRPFLSSTGAASQTTYYVSCEFFDVTILNGRQSDIDISSDYDKVQQVIQTAKKSMYIDEEIEHLGHAESESIIGVSDESDYFVSIHKNALTRDNLNDNVRHDELLADGGTLLLQVARIRGMLLSSAMVSIDVQFYGNLVDLFDILTITILGASRRMVVVSVENNHKEERQTVTLIEAKMAAENTLSNSLNYIK